MGWAKQEDSNQQHHEKSPAAEPKATHNGQPSSIVSAVEVCVELRAVLKYGQLQDELLAQDTGGAKKLGIGVTQGHAKAAAARKSHQQCVKPVRSAAGQARLSRYILLADVCTRLSARQIHREDAALLRQHPVSGLSFVPHVGSGAGQHRVH